MRYLLLIGFTVALLISGCGYKTDLELPEEDTARSYTSLNPSETCRFT